MKNDFLPDIDVNVCKSDSCKNMARPNCADYQSPSYHLGFPALYCCACGSNNRLLNNDDINKLVKPELEIYYQTVQGRCPCCYSREKRRYGKTAKGTVRWQCRSCRKVFSDNRPYANQTDKLKRLADLLFSCSDFKEIVRQLNVSDSAFYRLLEQLAQLLTRISRKFEQRAIGDNEAHIANYSFTLACKNAAPSHKTAQLWGLASADARSGYQFLTSLNYTCADVSDDSVYHYYPPRESLPDDSSLIDKIARRYALFTQRASFDWLVYSDAPAASKKGRIIMPVVTAQSHFHRLKHYLPRRRYFHYLQHEILIRGACLTAFGSDIADGNARLFYLAESKNAAPHNRFQLRNRRRLGWWRNLWYEFYSPYNHSYRLLGLLTPKNQLDDWRLAQLPATFYESKSFIRYFETIFPLKRLQTLSPNVIQLIFSIYTVYYNYGYLVSAGQTPAQRAALTNRRYRLTELIDLDEDC